MREELMRLKSVVGGKDGRKKKKARQRRGGTQALLNRMCAPVGQCKRTNQRVLEGRLGRLTRGGLVG